MQNETRTEQTYNLFLYAESESIREIGIVVHELEGTDDEKVASLQARAATDFTQAERHQLSPPLKWSTYEGLLRLGRELSVFEPLLRKHAASAHPIVVITPIHQGKMKVNATAPVGSLDVTVLPDVATGPGVMVDYLRKYVRDGHFDIPRLLNDDFFNAIRILFNARHFVSAAKLLMSFVDTVGFLEFGDVPANFVQWVERFAKLDSLQINAVELWEFRNGILHMSNLSSRKVIAGTVCRLIFYVGTLSQPLPLTPQTKYFNLKALIDVIAAAVSKWIETHNNGPGKLADFVARYDLTISDSRLAYIFEEV